MLKFRLKQLYKRLFPKKSMKNVDPQIAINNCEYWRYTCLIVYSPFHTAQDVFTYLIEKEIKANSNVTASTTCFGGCYGGCGCGGCV